MKKPTKILAVLLLLALTAALLCGCGGKATVTVTLESDVTLIPPAGGLDKLFASATTQMNRIIVTLNGSGTGKLSADVEGTGTVEFTFTVKNSTLTVAASPEIPFTLAQED